MKVIYNVIDLTLAVNHYVLVLFRDFVYINIQYLQNTIVVGRYIIIIISYSTEDVD